MTSSPIGASGGALIQSLPVFCLDSLSQSLPTGHSPNSGVEIPVPKGPWAGFPGSTGVPFYNVNVCMINIR